MASGDTLAIFSSANAQPTSTTASYAVIGDLTCFAFDGASNEDLVFCDVMPQAYSGGGVTAYIYWTCDGTTGAVDWDLSFDAIVADTSTITGASYAAVNSADTNTVPGAASVLTVTSIAFTDGADMDSVQAGGMYRLKLTRDAASDTNNSTAQAYFVELRET